MAKVQVATVATGGMAVRVFLLLAVIAAMSGCAKLTLAWADLDGAGPPARPPLFSVTPPTVHEWESEERTRLLAAFQNHVFGRLPDNSSVQILRHEALDENAFDGAGVLEEYKVVATARFGEIARETNPFFIDVVYPKSAKANAPIILMETFCPRWDTIPHSAVHRPKDARACEDGGFRTSVMKYVFGRYIATPPVETILAHGYAVAAIFPDEIVPDSRERGIEELNRLAAGHAESATRWGAVAAWAWAYSRAVDVLDSDKQGSGEYIVWGHSRYAKSALLAAAFDPRIDAVIAHQSGTGGASLSKEKRGETVKDITSSYPHWFAPIYAEYAEREEDIPVDHHQLLALIAPRPMLLGNARRDVWSDPSGAFRAAEAASAAYAIYGETGLRQTSLSRFDPDADIAFWIRPGTHGVVKEDWPAFLEFLDAHFSE